MNLGALDVALGYGEEHMRRREFMLALGGAVAWPLAAGAQSPAATPRIGVLWHAATEQDEAAQLGAVRLGLRDLGYVEGRNVTLVNTFANEQYERFSANAAELVAKKVDVILAVTRPAAIAAQRATKTIPIVFVVVPDPVGSKLVESLAQPGGNVTGLSNMALDVGGKRVELLKDAVPGVSRVALLLNAADPDIVRRYIEETRIAADRLGIYFAPVEVSSPDDIDRAYDKIAAERLDGIVVNNDPMLFNERKRLAEITLTHGLPSMMFLAEMVDVGGLMSYGHNNLSLFRGTAAYIDKILKGTKPADLPVIQPTKFELVINLKTANTLGLTMPPNLLARADKVIE